MKCAVIEIVISVIISGICLAAGDIGNELAITDGPSIKIQSCIRKIIEHILQPSESLAFMISGHPDYIPSQLPNPVTIVDIRVSLPTHYKRYEVNYVIEAESYALFVETLNIIRRNPLWHLKESPKGKFVILTKQEEVLQNIFLVMWRNIWALHVIVVIYEDTSKNCPIKIITSNPQTEGNYCARYPAVFSNFSCDNISLEFLKPIRNYNACPVYILPNKEIYKFNLNEKGDRMMYNVLAGLNRTLNATPIFLFEGGKNRALKAYQHNEVVLFQSFFGKVNAMENSIIYSRRLLLWIGPQPTKISPLKTVFLPFKDDLWIAVLFITILIILLKWLIIKGNGCNNHCVNLACAFTDIIGLTFGVCVNRIPNIWSLKLLLGFFLIYMIHIHTAYTSDLIDILTVPRYEGRIKDVKEVAARGLRICMFEYLAKIHFANGSNGGSLFEKIQKLIIPYERIDLHLTNLTKHFVVGDEDEISTRDTGSQFNSRFTRKTKRNIFLTNDISGEIKEVFLLENGSYFAESLNALITHLWESGTYEADAKLNPSPFNVTSKQSVCHFDTLFLGQDIPTPLSLKALLPIFIIQLICYSFCIIIFVAEIFVHKIVTWHSNKVVPLNV